WHSGSAAYLNYWGDSDLGLVDELHISRVERSIGEISAHAVRCDGGRFSLSRMLPAQGGNTGVVTAGMYGCGILAGAQAKLTGSGENILATNTSITPPSTLIGTFNLQGVPTGSRNLVVTNPNGTSATLLDALTVEQGGAAQISVGIIGRNSIRI